MEGRIDKKIQRIEYHFGKAGCLAPLIVVAATIVLSVGILSMVAGVISVAIVALGDLINADADKIFKV